MRNLFIFLPLLVVPMTIQAADTVTVNIRGTLIAPTVCNVTKTGDIDFGEIKHSDINGANYKQDLGVSLTCTDRNSTEIVYITLTGNGASGNKLPVAGTAKGFDLALKRNTTTQNFNTRFRVDSNGSLNLNVTPEQNSPTYTAGPFTAAITVTVDVV